MKFHKLNTPKSNLIHSGALLVISSALLFIILVVINGFLYPGYSHLANFMSDLGAFEAPYPYIQRINFFQFGLGILIHAIVMYKGMERPSILVLVFHLVIGLGIFLSGIFPGHSSDPDSYESFLHNLVGLPAFLSIIVTSLFSGFVFRNNLKWRDLYRYSMMISPFLVLMLFLMIREDVVVDDGIPGLYQRMFIGTWILWMIIVSIRLIDLEKDQSVAN